MMNYVIEIQKKFKINYLICLGLFSVVLCLNLGCSINFKQTNSSQDDVTKKSDIAIKNDSLLQTFDTLCKQIPVMENFQFDSKNALMKKKNVIYFYRSSDNKRVNYLNLSEFYTKYLKENGWKKIAEDEYGKYVEFKKEDIYVLVSTTSDSGADFGKVYGISCKGHSYSMVE